MNTSPSPSRSGRVEKPAPPVRDAGFHPTSSAGPASDSCSCDGFMLDACREPMVASYSPASFRVIRSELASLARHVNELQEHCERIQTTISLQRDAERDLNHLSARLEGTVRQMEDMTAVTKRMMTRAVPPAVLSGRYPCRTSDAETCRPDVFVSDREVAEKTS